MFKMNGSDSTEILHFVHKSWLSTFIKFNLTVVYHGNLVGFNNIFVIDNFSTDNTFDILQKLSKSHGIHLEQKKVCI